jgi:hypothetical protein
VFVLFRPRRTVYPLCCSNDQPFGCFIHPDTQFCGRLSLSWYSRWYPWKLLIVFTQCSLFFILFLPFFTSVFLFALSLLCLLAVIALCLSDLASTKRAYCGSFITPLSVSQSSR